MFHEVKIAFFLALRAIKRGNKGTTIVTVVIMTLAVINLLFMPSILDGMNHKSQLQVVENQLGHIVIEPKDGESLLDNFNSLQKKINAFSEVAGSSIRYSEGATLLFEDKSSTRRISFIDPMDEKTVTQIHEFMVEGDYLSKLDTDEIIIGNEVAGTHDSTFESASLGGVIAGDKITIKFNNGLIRTYKVKGVFKTRYVTGDMHVYINNKELENIFGIKNKANSINIKLNREGIESEFIKKLQIMGVGEDIYNSRDRSGIEMTQTFDIIRTMMSAIALLISVATLFIVVYINAISKRKIIAVIKAIGINKRIIIISFILQSLFYAISGAIVGLLVLYLILVPYFIANPLSMPFGAVSLLVQPKAIFNSIIYLLITAIIAGFVPAYQVTKQNIINAMRS